MLAFNYFYKPSPKSFFLSFFFRVLISEKNCTYFFAFSLSISLSLSISITISIFLSISISLSITLSISLSILWRFAFLF